ncbi:MAG: hypothetical protein KF690_06585 [Bacteroidetes bacterium]|nr:hypothetical protein [Bacteroidota bacterium]
MQKIIQPSVFLAYLWLWALYMAGPAQAQNTPQFMVAYQTEQGWYVFNTRGDSLLSPGMLGLTGPVQGPAFGFICIRQLHRLDPQTLMPETHQILMDATGKRYMENLSVDERIRFIIEGRYVGTEHQKNGANTVYDMTTGKVTIPGEYVSAGPAHGGLIFLNGLAESNDDAENHTWLAVDYRTGKKRYTLTDVSYLEKTEDGLLLAHKEDDSVWQVDAAGKLKPYKEESSGEYLETEDTLPTEPFEVESNPQGLTVKDAKGKVLVRNLDAEMVDYVCRGFVAYAKNENMGLFRISDQKHLITPAAGYSEIYVYPTFLEAFGSQNDTRRLVLMKPDGAPHHTPGLDTAYYFMSLQAQDCDTNTPAPPATVQYFIPR